MAQAVPFNYNTFVTTFPEFTGIDAQLAQIYWDMATSLLRNDGTSPVPTEAMQAQLLNLLTAHMAKLFAPKSAGGQAGGLVGRISSATEGSVTVQTEWASQISDTQAFYVQTAYGAQYWAMTATFRTMRYRSPPARPTGPPWVGMRPRWW